MNEQNSTILNVLQKQFKALEAQMNGKTNSAAHLARKSTFETVKTSGLPNRKNEEYRYTPLAKQLENEFSNFISNPAATIISTSPKQLPELSGSLLVFINGVFNKNISRIVEQKGTEIIIANSQQELMENSPDSAASTDVFSGLNFALASSGSKITIAKGSILESPINIIHISDTEKGKIMTTSRHEVNIGENAQATITEMFIGIGNNRSFTNSAMDVSVAPHAILNHYKVGLDSDNDLRIDNSCFSQQKNSVLNTVNVNFGGKLIRNNLKISLDDEYCETHLYGLYMPTANGYIDNHTIVDHKLPNSNSNELYKGIMGEHATGIFNGKVFVREDAQKTNAFQTNNNILLADTAIINTKPQLEIWADDVKCTHGCTTGQMDKEQLFYLRARGIDKENAQKLLLKAFAEEVIEKINDDTLRARVAAILEEKLNS